MTQVTQTMIHIMPDRSVAIGSELWVSVPTEDDSLRHALLVMVHERDMAGDDPPIESVPGGYLVDGQFYQEGVPLMFRHMEAVRDGASA